MTRSNLPTISLAEKVVLVTGASRGIGLAVAGLAVQCGAQVACCDIQAGGISDPAVTENQLQLVGDVSRENDCERLVAQTVDHFGRIDVLVNNAGILEPARSTLKQDLAGWRKVLDVNLQGTFTMALAAARIMADLGIQGSIVNISSVAGLSGFRASNAYGVSKAGVAMLTKTLAVDLAPRRIRINAVAPGFINSVMTSNLRDDTKMDPEAFIGRIPMGRFGDPLEIAKAVVFLASDCASYITGTVLPVDGGWLAFGGPGTL